MLNQLINTKEGKINILIIQQEIINNPHLKKTQNNLNH